MFEAISYTQNSFSIAFPRYPLIRRQANEFEDLLKGRFAGHYGQPQVISVPDDLDPEVPRMIFGSKHGFSQIVISQVNMTLNISYSPGWQASIDKGRDYLKERTSALYLLLSALDDTPVYFTGLTTRATLPANVPDDGDLLAAFRQRVAQLRLSTENVHDINLKVTTVVGDRFFSNISIRNYRAWKLDGQALGVPRLSRSSAEERGLEIVGDFNDRYSYNEGKDYVSTEKVAHEVIDRGLEQIQTIHQTIRMNGGL
jgi:hypothetical protein